MGNGVILACGEAIVDLLPEEADGELIYRPVLGGSLCNVALCVARLGGQAGYLWEISTDRLGAMVRAALDAAGVDRTVAAPSERATPVALVDLSGPEPRYNIADPDRVMCDTLPPPLPGEIGCLVVGSAVLALEPVGEAIERLAEACECVAIDYNVRPPSIADRDVYWARLRRISERATIVKASVADFKALGLDDPRAIMQSFVNRGVGLTILTEANEGASAWTAAGTARVPSSAKHIVDTVGAGDAFMAGALVHLQRHGALNRVQLATHDCESLAGLLGFAQSVAAVTCGRRGAVMPSLADLPRGSVSNAAMEA